jgi:hypothetical protein
MSQFQTFHTKFTYYVNYRFPKEKYCLQKNKTNAKWGPSVPSSFSQDISEHCLISTCQPTKTRKCQKLDVCNSLLQNRMYDRTTKKCKYEAIVSCASVVSHFMLRKIRFVTCTGFYRLFTIRLKAGLPVYINFLPKMQSNTCSFPVCSANGKGKLW